MVAGITGLSKFECSRETGYPDQGGPGSQPFPGLSWSHTESHVIGVDQHVKRCARHGAREGFQGRVTRMVKAWKSCPVRSGWKVFRLER